MKSTHVPVGIALLSLFLIPYACGAPFSDKTDIIYKIPTGTMPAEGSGKVYRVIEETFESITVRPDTGGQIAIPAKNVDRVEHFDAPDEFKLGMGAIQSSNFEQAVKHFDSIKAKDSERPWLKIYVLFYRAEAMRQWGGSDKQKNAEAVELYEKLLATHKNNIFKAKAMLGSAIASIQEGKYDVARGKLEEIKTELFGTRWETMADLWRAKIHEREGDFGKAAHVYVSIANRTEAGADVRREAQLGEIKCLSKQDKHDRALQKAKKFVKENNDPKVLGGAWNVIGDCHMALVEKGGPDEIRRARLAYLRVVVVYFFDAQAAAEAAFKAGRCFERLKEPKRAVDQYERAVETVGGGDWVKKAEERLKAIK